MRAMTLAKPLAGVSVKIATVQNNYREDESCLKISQLGERGWNRSPSGLAIAHPHRKMELGAIMDRCASVRIFVAMAATTLLMSATAGPAAAQNVKWQTIVGIVAPGNQVGPHTTTDNSTTPPTVTTTCGTDCITGAGTPWSTLGGQAKVNLANGQLQFNVSGLVLAGGNSIGTPGTQAQVKGTLICITTGINPIIDTTPVPLSSSGAAQFSGSVGTIPGACLPSNIAFLIRLVPATGASRWVANGAVRTNSAN